MTQSKPKKQKEYVASYLKDMQKPDANGFYDDGFEKVPGINAAQLNQTISIQT